jgi:MFS family permease
MERDEESPRVAGARTSGRRLSGVQLIVLMCAAEGLAVLGFSTLPALQPILLVEWAMSNTEAGWVNGIYFAAYMAAVPVLVGLTDQVDPRRVYAVGAVISVLSSLGFAVLADGFWDAMLYRGLGGMGLAGTYMPGLKALTDHIDERLRSRAVAFYTASLSIGFALSFLFSGEIAALLDWRWAFALLGLGSAAALPMVIFLVPPSEPHHIAKPKTALLDFRPVLRNRRTFAYVLAYSAHNWELFAFRSWIVTFFVFCQGVQDDGALGLGWSATALAALIGILGLPASVLGNEAAVLQEIALREKPEEVAQGDPDFVDLDALGADFSSSDGLDLKAISKRAAQIAEKRVIELVLHQTRWNRKEAAERLQISYKALLYKMKENGLSERR